MHYFSCVGPVVDCFIYIYPNRCRLGWGTETQQQSFSRTDALMQCLYPTPLLSYFLMHYFNWNGPLGRVRREYIFWLPKLLTVRRNPPNIPIITAL